MFVRVRAPPHTASGLFLSVCFDTNRSERVGKRKKIHAIDAMPFPCHGNQSELHRPSFDQSLARAVSLLPASQSAPRCNPGTKRAGHTSARDARARHVLCLIKRAPAHRHVSASLRERAAGPRHRDTWKR